MASAQVGRKFVRSLVASLLGSAAFVAAPSHAQDATWTNGGNNNFSNSANWNPATVPTNVATFADTGQNTVDVSVALTVKQFDFAPNAQSYSILTDDSLTITGLNGIGIQNRSAQRQTVTNLSLFKINDSRVIGGVGGVDLFNAAGALIFSNSSIDLKTTVTTQANSALAPPGGVNATPDALTKFTGTSSADGVMLATYGGFASAVGAGSKATGGKTTLSFTDSSHADNATFTTSGGLASASGDAPSAAANAFGGNAILTFADTSHADGATFNNGGGISIAIGSTFATGNANAYGGDVLVTLAGSSHVDRAIFTNTSGGASAIGGTGDDGVGAVNGANGGTAAANAGSVRITLNDASHADGASFTNSSGSTGAVAGKGGDGGTGAVSGKGGDAFAVSGYSTVIFNGTSRADGATIVNGTVGMPVFASGGAGGDAATFGEGGQGGDAFAAASENSVILNDNVVFRNMTITNRGGDAIADGGFGGRANPTGIDGGAGGGAIAHGSAAIVTLNDNASLGTGTVITNRGGDATARGGAGGASHNGFGGAGGAADAAGGAAFVSFYDTSSAGNAVISNQAGNLSAISGDGGNADGVNGRAGGDATASNGQATIEFNDQSTAGNATITNLAAPGTATIAGGNYGADGDTSGRGGSPGAVSATINVPTITFNDNATGGSAHLIVNAGQVNFNDNSLFGSAAGGGALIDLKGGGVIFNDTASLGNGSITATGPSTILFFDTASAGTGRITTAANSFLYFNDSATAGTATINNGGSTRFNDTSTAATARIVNGATGELTAATTGILSIGSLSGGGTVINNSGISVGGLGLTDTFGGVIANAGSLTKVGTGTLILTGTNTYTGGTTITAGTLQFGNGGTTGSVVGNIVDNGNLAFNRSDTVTYAATVSGSGALTQMGPGTLVLTGNNSYAGLTDVTAGVLNVQSNAALGSTANGTIVRNGATLQLQGGVTIGGEALTLNGSGTGGVGALVNVSGNNSFGGPITLATNTRVNSIQGLLLLSGLVDGATQLTVGGAGDVTFTGAISTLSSLIIDGTGTVTLSGANTFTGPTSVNSGFLRLQGGSALADTDAVTVSAPGILQVAVSETIGSLAGNGQVQLLNGSTFAVGGNNASTTFSGAIINGNPTGGGLTKIGTGTLVLTGSSTYTGTTNVAAGMLQLEGRLTSPTTIASGATLRGTGQVAGTLTNNGTLIAGNAATPLGTLSVTGNFTNAAGSVFAPTLAANGTANGLSSLVQAGSVTLAGGTVRPTLQSGGFLLMQTDFRIASGSGGLSGTFGSLDTSFLPTGFGASLLYTSSDATVRVRRTVTRFGQAAGLTRNERATGLAFDAAVTAGNPLVYTTFLDTYNALLTTSTLPAALRISSGDALTTVPVAAQGAVERFDGRLTDYTWSNSSNLWGTIAYGDERADGNGNGPGFRSNGVEAQLGFATSLAEKTRLGISGGYAKGDLAVRGRDASADIDSYMIGARLRQDFGGAFLAGQLGYGWHNVDTTRAILLGGNARGRFNASTLTGSIEGGFVAKAGKLDIEPFVAYRYARTDQNGYAESGGVGALNVADASFKSSRLGGGIRLVGRDKDAAIKPMIAVRYDRELGDRVLTLDSNLPGLPVFKVDGTTLGRNIVSAELGIEAKLGGGVSLFAAGSGRWRQNDTSLQGNAGIRFRF